MKAPQRMMRLLQGDVGSGKTIVAALAALQTIAPGNGLAVLEETDSGVKDPPSKTISDAIRAAGGDVRPFVAPRQDALAAWIEANR